RAADFVERDSYGQRRHRKSTPARLLPGGAERLALERSKVQRRIRGSSIGIEKRSQVGSQVQLDRCGDRLVEAPDAIGDRGKCPTLTGNLHRVWRAGIPPRRSRSGLFGREHKRQLLARQVLQDGTG